MAAVLHSTTANEAVTLSDDTAVCGFQNVRPAADFERCCINPLKLPRVLDLNFILTRGITKQSNAVTSNE